MFKKFTPVIFIAIFLLLAPAISLANYTTTHNTEEQKSDNEIGNENDVGYFGSFENYKKQIEEKGRDQVHREMEAARQERLRKERQCNGDECIYKNEYFKIRFPQNWLIEEGSGETVVKKAINEGSSIVITSQKLKELFENNPLEKEDWDSVSLNSLSEEELNIFFSNILALRNKIYPKSEIIEKETVLINGDEFLFFKVKNSSEFENQKIEGVAMNYVTLRDGKYYQIIGSYPTAPLSEEDKQSSIQKSINSFDFISNAKANNKENGVNYKKEYSLMGIFNPASNYTTEEVILILLSSFVFTWMLGLAIPILVRYALVKKPSSKAKSLLIVVPIFFAQVGIAVLMGSKSNSHLALLLVAFVNYAILSKGYAKQEKVEKAKQVHPELQKIKDKRWYRLLKVLYFLAIAVMLTLGTLYLVSGSIGNNINNQETGLTMLLIIIPAIEVIKRSFYYILTGQIFPNKKVAKTGRKS
ncbi:MAG: hypothetical protein ACOCUF_01160 [Patescibacteria group bacterium]